MKLYHGTSVPNLTELRPFPSNHDKAYVYLTHIESLALFYAYNPVERPGGFFPYWVDREGQLHYDEYFPDQTRIIYQGRGGYVCTVEAEGLPRLEKMSWVHLSEDALPMAACRFIPDLYDAILQAEKEGKLILHRYETLPEKAREQHREIVRRSLENHGEDSYRIFIRQHMPECETPAPQEE